MLITYLISAANAQVNVGCRACGRGANIAEAYNFVSCAFSRGVLGESRASLRGFLASCWEVRRFPGLPGDFLENFWGVSGQIEIWIVFMRKQVFGPVFCESLV